MVATNTAGANESWHVDLHNAYVVQHQMQPAARQSCPPGLLADRQTGAAAVHHAVAARLLLQAILVCSAYANSSVSVCVSKYAQGSH